MNLKDYEVGGQMNIFDLGSQYGRTSPELLAATAEKIFESSLKNWRESKKQKYQFLCLKTESGSSQERLLTIDGLSHGEHLMPNTTEYPNEEKESSLSQILQANAPEKYYLSSKACIGILRRALRRGKQLPRILEQALVDRATGERNSLTVAQKQTLFQPVCLQGSMISRKDENGPQGDGINIDKSFTLNTIDRHAVAYGICSFSSNSMKSDNSHSGIYETDTARTLDLNGGNPACNQGGICICEPIVMDMTHANDVLRIYDDGVIPCLQHRMGTGGNQIPLIAEPIYSIDNEGFNQGENCESRICCGRSEEMFFLDDAKMGHTYAWEEQANTLLARDYHAPQAVCYKDESSFKYIVRRLTPTECARLQGMPDLWCRLSQIDDMSDEDYEFWREAHKTHAKINGKTYKEKTKKQMIAWYNKLQTDGAEYKAYGNGMALPCARVPIHGIAQRGAKTMASLFDGIGGFPLAGLLDGIKTLWTSEIELFPIAVTMERFQEFEKYGYFIFGRKSENLSTEKEIKQMELKIEQYQLPDKIRFNFEELKSELQEKVNMYETMVYTDEQIKEAKTDKANLNKLKKALNDERIRREKEYMTPFNIFKEQVNEIIAIIDKPVAVIDKQIKAYEDKQKQDKLDAITAYFNDTSHPEWLHLSQIYDEKWLNASVSMKAVKEAISARLTQIEIDLITLHNLPEFGFEASEVYKTTLDINKAIAEGHRLSEIQKRKVEAERARAEKEAEQARLAAEREFAQAMNPPIDEVAATEAAIPPVVRVEAPAKQWVAFQALLSTADALALKDFFDSRNIEFKAV